MSESIEEKARAVHSDIEIQPYELGQTLPDFSCGKNWFDDFIATDEIEEYHRERLGQTKLVYYQGEFAAFYSVSPNSMTEEDYSQKVDGADQLHEGPFDMPARLLGHLAVDEDFKDNGIGTYLVLNMIDEAIQSDTPFRIVLLHAHDDVITWYKDKFDFVECRPQKDESPAIMFYDLGHAD